MILFSLFPSSFPLPLSKMYPSKTQICVLARKVPHFKASDSKRTPTVFVPMLEIAVSGTVHGEDALETNMCSVPTHAPSSLEMRMEDHRMYILGPKDFKQYYKPQMPGWKTAFLSFPAHLGVVLIF